MVHSQYTTDNSAEPNLLHEAPPDDAHQMYLPLQSAARNNARPSVSSNDGALRFMDFFAGAGLVRLGLEPEWACAWANDIDPRKQDVYERWFGHGEFVLGDIADVRVDALPAGVDMPAAPPMPYPLAEFAQARDFLQVIRPAEKFRQLADAGWPPAPGYFPNVLAFVHKNPDSLQDGSIVRAVTGAYGRDLWRRRLDLWTEAKFFPGRLEYIRKAIEEYLEEDWVSSTYVMVPQFEGIIRDYLARNDVPPGAKFKDQIGQLKAMVLSRKILLFPRQVLELILQGLETGTFWRKTRQIGDPQQEVNRHGIAHGVFTGFECREIALKYLVLLDGLGMLLLHDKILRNSMA